MSKYIRSLIVSGIVNCENLPAALEDATVQTATLNIIIQQLALPSMNHGSKNVTAGTYMHSWANNVPTLLSTISAKKILSQLAMVVGNIMAGIFIKMLCETPDFMLNPGGFPQIAQCAAEQALGVIYLVCTMPVINKVDEYIFLPGGIDFMLNNAVENGIKNGVSPQTMNMLKSDLISILGQVNIGNEVRMPEWIHILETMPQKYREAGYNVLGSTLPIEKINMLIQYERNIQLLYHDDIGSTPTILTDIEKAGKNKVSSGVSGAIVPTIGTGMAGRVNGTSQQTATFNQILLNNAIANQLSLGL